MKKAGRPGFAGLVPNEAGLIPPLSHRLQQILGPAASAEVTESVRALTGTSPVSR